MNLHTKNQSEIYIFDKLMHLTKYAIGITGCIYPTLPYANIY